MRRCGVAPGEPVLALAKEIVKHRKLRFAGLHAYHGRAQHVRSTQDRRVAIEKAATAVQVTKAPLDKKNIPCHVVTGPGTRTHILGGGPGAWVGIQPRSSVCSDA